MQASVRGLTGPRVVLRWRRGRPAREPIVVAGFHSSVVGVGQSARLFAAALEGAGARTARLDTAASLAVAAELAAPPSAVPPGGVLVSHLNPPELQRWLGRDGARALRRRRHIGYWMWELPTPAPHWPDMFRYVDEVWCQSALTAAAVRAAAPADLPVRMVPHPVFMTERAAPDRARFALPEGACAILAGFDLRSTSARKNPEGALEAYRRARPAPAADALLLLKAIGGDTEPAALEALRRAVAGRPDIRLLAEPLDAHGQATLLASIDVLLTLHRAEGFGLQPAEAIWLGKPVVSTAAGAVMEFLDADSAALVPWREVAIDDPQGVYSGVWAEPDLDAAAAALDRLIRDPSARAALGHRARARAEQVFDRETWLARVLPLLGAAPRR